MSIDTTTQAQLRLLQMLSPAAPVGSYSYSQGIEWAVEKGWVVDEANFRQWISEQINSTLCRQELPLLRKLYFSFLENNIDAAKQWSELSIAVRDTAELRQEERDRAEAYLRLLDSIETIPDTWPRAIFLNTSFAAMAWFGVKHNICSQALFAAYAHNWLESTVVTGIKVIPLGQSVGQAILFELSSLLVAAIDESLTISDANIGLSLPALGVASCGHETQYSRVYRS